MISFDMELGLMSPQEVSLFIASQAQKKRLSLNMTQKELSHRSGVSFGVIKKFEISGNISLKSLLKIALVLGSLLDFKYLFKPKEPEKYSSIEALLKDAPRKRARK
jgi:transcriptional regulator with XRE-family HTH domain